MSIPDATYSAVDKQQITTAGQVIDLTSLGSNAPCRSITFVGACARADLMLTGSGGTYRTITSIAAGTTFAAQVVKIGSSTTSGVVLWVDW
jgi:hypothetical protein